MMEHLRANGVGLIRLILPYRSMHTPYLRCMPKPWPALDRRIFWDVDYDRMDLDAKWRFVIERVFERGDVEDIRQCRRYYGDEKVRQALLEAKYLPEQTIYLASAVVGEPLEKFRCYTATHSRPGSFPY